MKRAEYYGIKISELKPGDIVTSEDLENLYEKNVPIGDNKKRIKPIWAFILTLKRDIESTLFDLGRYARCVQRRNDLHVIQGASLSDYTANQAEKGIGKLLKEATIMNLVDMADMDGDQINRHNRAVFVLSNQCGALEDINNKIAMTTGSVTAARQIERKKDKSEWENKQD